MKKKIQVVSYKDEIHASLPPLGVYDKLRQAHSLIKDCLYAENNWDMDEELQMAIKTVHYVLYLAEGVAVKVENKTNLLTDNDGSRKPV